VRKEVLITAAGGNGTAVQILSSALSREQYTRAGKVLGDKWEAKGAEQAGFLIADHQHFEMAGGEFCGNASRAAAILFSEATGKSDVLFTVSGFKDTVRASVTPLSADKFHVRCTFPGMRTDTHQVTLNDGTQATIVDLGGIVHVVIEGTFPCNNTAYEQAHRSIMNELSLAERDAVGVIWYEHQGGAVYMHPVVWVNAVDTFFYETSCGSGTIAVGKVTGETQIVQPTGQTICAEITDSAVTLESDMEVVH
jgi:diaminopimelate epimerase